MIMSHTYSERKLVMPIDRRKLLPNCTHQVEIALLIKLSTFVTMATQRTLAIGGRITAGQVSSLNGLDLTKQEIVLFFTCTETTESEPVKLDTAP